MSTHLQIVIALVCYFVFSSLAGAMLPPLPGKERTVYGFLFRAIQLLAANGHRLAEAKVAGLVEKLAASEARQLTLWDLLSDAEDSAGSRFAERLRREPPAVHLAEDDGSVALPSAPLAASDEDEGAAIFPEASPRMQAITDELNQLHQTQPTQE